MADCYRRFFFGRFLRLVLAILRSSALLIDLYMLREAPLSDDLERLPRLAASAAPAAICCFFDLAGIHKEFVSQLRIGLACQAVGMRRRVRPQPLCARRNKPAHRSTLRAFRFPKWPVREMPDRPSTTRRAIMK